MSRMRVAQLRIGQQDLKCKRGCGYYGYWQFEGLCSKCFRERNDKKKKLGISSTARGDKGPQQVSPSETSSRHSHFQQSNQTKQSLICRKADSANESSGKKKSFVPAVFQKKQIRHKNEQESGTPSTTANVTNNYLQSNIIVTQQQQQQQSFHSAIESHFIMQLRQLRIPDDGKRKLKSEIQRLDGEIRAYISNPANAKNVEELSELVQNAYTKFSDLVQTDARFQIATNEDRESAIDCFEKVVMTQNHKFLFSPYFTDDEQNDVTIQRRIRQLSWITAKHLACSIDEVNAESRELVYNAITELVAIDSFYSPQEKLECTVRCCRHIFELLKHSVGGPASADEFLPALIFVVLKANPVRLHSNINFVTRFTNAVRLMSGEGGYYFTNLCCAISFIENLNHESLSMDAKEFDLLMSGSKPFSTPWESALLACESLHLISENMKRLEMLKLRNYNVTKGIEQFRDDLSNFQIEITAKVEDCLAKAPLTILPIKTPASLIPEARALLENPTGSTSSEKRSDGCSKSGYYQDNLLNTIDMISKGSSSSIKKKLKDNIQAFPLTSLKVDSTASPKKFTTADDSVLPSSHHTLIPQDSSLIAGRLSPIPSYSSNQNQTDILFASPIFNYTPFDANSITTCSYADEELMVPINYNGGLRNINYDFDLSDHSNDNSIKEEIKVPLDLEEFDPLLKPVTSVVNTSPQQENKSILDRDSPSQEALLPSPLKPIITDYRGFSNCNIPTISCNTGDFSSLNHNINNELQHLDTNAMKSGNA